MKLLKIFLILESFDLADFLITAYLLKNNLGYELNPVMTFFFEKGFFINFLFSTIVVFLMSFMLVGVGYIVEKEWCGWGKKIQTIGILIFCIPKFFVILWNLKIVF